MQTASQQQPRMHNAFNYSRSARSLGTHSIHQEMDQPPRRSDLKDESTSNTQQLQYNLAETQKTRGSPPGQTRSPHDAASSAATAAAAAATTSTTSPSFRTRSTVDGPPIPPPPRTSSNHQRTQRSANNVKEHKTHRQHSQPSGHAAGNAWGLEHEDAARASTHSRRHGPTSPEESQRSGRNGNSQPNGQYATTTTTTTVIGAPIFMPKEYDNVTNQTAVSDGSADAGREHEHLAEPRSHAPDEADTSSDTLPVDGARGTRSRQDHSNHVARRKETKFGDYILGQTLGEGEFGKVKLGWKIDGSVQVAIKLIRRETLGSNPGRLPKIYREISILRELSHPNIVRLHEMVETDRHIGIILEYASGGELFDYILNHRYLKDGPARRLFAQLISGVGYLHKKGIVHRDLKLENLLLDRNRNIIITDFGFANTFDPNDELSEELASGLTDKDFVRKMGLERPRSNGFRRGDLMQTSCGSPCYAAPELVVSDSLYTGRKVDVWSCGVILYAMLAGYLPFDDDPANPEGDNINLLYKYIVSTPLTFPEYVTPHARDLLRRILVPDPRKRADLFEVARHSWLSDYAHVVSHITSSTTTVGYIVNTTVTADDQQEGSLLARSASVREPPRHPSSRSAVGGLNRQDGNKLPTEEEAEKPRHRDPKRRTVQVEYVAPKSQTVRETANPQASGAPKVPPKSQPGLTQQHSASNAVRQATPGEGKRLPPEPRRSQSPTKKGHVRPTTSGPSASHKASRTAQQTVPVPFTSSEVPRSQSDSTTLGLGQTATTLSARPGTGGSMTRGVTATDVRLPSRGSYGQPVAPTVAATNAQARLAQPKPSKQYGQQGYQRDLAGHRRGSRVIQAPSRQGQPEEQGHSSHKRSNTIGGIGERIFGRSGSIFGGKAGAPNSRQKSSKTYPPTSMKEPVVSNTPRQSTESRRPSVSMSRKKSDIEPTGRSRRFSILPASFSFKSFAPNSKDSSIHTLEPDVDPREASQVPASRNGRPRMQTLDGSSSVKNVSDAVTPIGFDGYGEPPRRSSIQQAHIGQYSEKPGHILTSQFRRSNHAARRDSHGITNDISYPEQSHIQADIRPEHSSLPTNASYFPMYTEGFNSNEDQSYPHPLHQQPQPPPPQQLPRHRTGKGTLQKNRKFADAYEHEHNPGHHSGTSGAARRVMDFFSRRRKARSEHD